LSPDLIIMTWLPRYHDMGLMGTILLTFHYGWSLVLMSPLNSIQEPRLWLKAISDYRAIAAVGPNFSLDMCVDAINAGEAEGLDLSSLTRRQPRSSTGALGVDVTDQLASVDVDIRQLPQQHRVVDTARGFGELTHRNRRHRGAVAFGEAFQSLHDVVGHVAQVQRFHHTMLAIC
jgi:hypothetical protein